MPNVPNAKRMKVQTFFASAPVARESLCVWVLLVLRLPIAWCNGLGTVMWKELSSTCPIKCYNKHTQLKILFQKGKSSSQLKHSKTSSLLTLAHALSDQSISYYPPTPSRLSLMTSYHYHIFIHS